MDMTKAVVFRGVGDLRIQEVPKPQPGPGEAVLRVTATTASADSAGGRTTNRPHAAHRPSFALDDMLEAYELFSRQGDGVLKVALYPAGIPDLRGLTTERSAAAIRAMLHRG